MIKLYQSQLEKQEKNIDDLLKQIPSDYKPYEEFDNKIGIEEW